MELILKGAAAAVCAGILAAVIRKTNPELSLGVCMAACGAVLLAALAAGGAVSDFAARARSFTGLPTAALRPVAKCVGIGIVTRLGADLCRDSGSTALSSAVELTGATAALIAALPLLSALLEMAEGIG